MPTNEIRRQSTILVTLRVQGEDALEDEIGKRVLPAHLILKFMQGELLYVRVTGPRYKASGELGERIAELDFWPSLADTWPAWVREAVKGVKI